jgi:hypothetical protein
MVGHKKFFPPPLLVLLLDPGWIKIRIRDKHPGSATLYNFVQNFCLELYSFLMSI